EQLRTATTTHHQEGEGDQELIHNVSVKFTNKGGSRFDGNGGSGLHGNQQVWGLGYVFVPDGGS
ncbi:MAG: hypothetical protein J0H72_28220, partial [Burkholderiales bacterium]|nr:hypothetical protein [Burkholderiales bacterium]